MMFCKTARSAVMESVLICTDWTPALPPGKDELGALCVPLAIYRPKPWPEGRPASILNCTDRSVPLGSHWGHSLAHLQRLTPEAFMLYLGQRLQDKAASLHLLSPFANSKEPKLASRPSTKLSPQGTGRKTAHSCAGLLEPTETARGGTWKGKRGLRNCTFTLCHFEATPRGLSALTYVG